MKLYCSGWHGAWRSTPLEERKLIDDSFDFRFRIRDGAVVLGPAWIPKHPRLVNRIGPAHISEPIGGVRLAEVRLQSSGSFDDGEVAGGS